MSKLLLYLKSVLTLVIIGHVSTETIRDKVNLVMIYKTKLNVSFPDTQIYMKS